MTEHGGREFPCPKPGCGMGAIARADEDYAIGDYLWQCRAGHHGPRLVLNQRIGVEA